MARKSDSSDTKEARLLEVFNPADGEKIGAVEKIGSDEAMRRLKRVQAAQKIWGARSHGQRKKQVRAFLELLYKKADEVAELLSRETGKPLYEAYLFEVIPLMHLTAYFLKRVEKILKPQRIHVSVFRNRVSYVHHKPRGVVLVISPWNFPLSIPFGEVVMALLAGNGVLLKPASRTPLIALKMAELFVEAGLDPELVSVMVADGRTASTVIDSGEVNYVNFTGSTQVGRRVGALAGKHLIAHSMELGGKDPALVCADADLDKAARSVVWGAFANSGQICASVERVYVHRDVCERFVEKVVVHTRALRQGAPLGGGEVDLGAMTDPAQAETVSAQLADAVEKGARLLTGGQRFGHAGLFFAPTVLVDVNEEMQVMREETFGPLLPIAPVDSIEEGIRRANDSPYGLNAYVFTRDARAGRHIAEQLEAGTVIVNDTLMTHAFPETPWGGVKESGMGRVHSDDGLRELTEARHVNYELFSLANPVWFPYSRPKARRFLAAFDLLDRQNGLHGKISSLWKLLRGSS
jgi:succinate-semialdehyde dehydrogenase/glutarate-semialdehyde dehydrogenase